MILQELGEAGQVREQVAGSKQRGERLDQQTSARHRLVHPSSSFTFHKEEYENSFPCLLLRHCHTLEWDRGVLNRYFSQQQGPKTYYCKCKFNWLKVKIKTKSWAIN